MNAGPEITLTAARNLQVEAIQIARAEALAGKITEAEALYGISPAAKADIYEALVKELAPVSGIQFSAKWRGETTAQQVWARVRALS